MPRETILNGKKRLAYSRVEALRGDGGKDLQEFMVDLIDMVGATDNAEERRLYRSLGQQRERERRGNPQAVITPTAPSMDDERFRLRGELMRRL